MEVRKLCLISITSALSLLPFTSPHSSRSVTPQSCTPTRTPATASCTPTKNSVSFQLQLKVTVEAHNGVKCLDIDVWVS